LADALERLIGSLLYEGYALYPYTPAATKNATPTPFGIVYPPAYAAGAASTFDHLELRCAVAAAADAQLLAEIRFLASSGLRHQATAHRLELERQSLGALTQGPLEREFRLGEAGSQQLTAGLTLAARRLGDALYEVRLRIANRTPCAEGLDRAGALAHALLSTHPLLRVGQGRFISPLEHHCASTNTFPVLASPADDAMLGAAIVLPDHPQIAPESRGVLFDSTEIEEALLLHVQVLSDSEREQIERADPAVREMVARAAAATPQDIVALHGRVTLRDPAGSGATSAAAVRSPVSETPPEEPPGLADPRAGEQEALVDGVSYRRGGKVRIRPGPDADLQARMLDGRSATIERILIDYDGKMHLGVTIDDDPGQDLMRDSGRYLFFFAPEVEVIGS
jgi:hypothetical protein